MECRTGFARFACRVVSAHGIGVPMLCMLLNGCAAPRLTSIRLGEPVSIVVEEPVVSIAVRNGLVGKDSSIGASGGLIAGGLSGLSCGPLALLCVPIGAMVGAGSGAIIGAVVGVAEGLPANKLDGLNVRLQAFVLAHDLREELRAHLVDSARHHWPVKPDTANARVKVRVDSVSLGLARGEQLAMSVQVGVAVDGGTAGPSRGDYKQFSYNGPPGPMSAWMDDSRGFAESNIRMAFQHIAAQIVADLAYE